MTELAKVQMVQTLVENDPNADAETVKVYLRLACHKMLERLWPYDSNKEESDLPVRYDTLQCELGARLFLRRGGEGELTHEENGINRTWDSVDDEDILSRLTPYAKVVG